MIQMTSKYKGRCSTCHFTIWAGEKINRHGKQYYHIDCKKALIDKTARELDPRYLGIYGTVDNKKLRNALKDTGQKQAGSNKELRTRE